MVKKPLPPTFEATENECRVNRGRSRLVNKESKMRKQNKQMKTPKQHGQAVKSTQLNSESLNSPELNYTILKKRLSELTGMVLNQ
jgi:hypothetical protein